ncbi:MAG: urate hydroxylase PuuD [Burkholderiaceae bacterium]|nr:urate hydroxylase PuuD [Burkholderiaceae bacterium]
MELNPAEWLNLVLRWFHVMAGISWLGGSLYLLWLARIFGSAQRSARGEAGEPWIVDLSGSLLVERLDANKPVQPKTHVWFKRETTFTWVSGMVLLAAGSYSGVFFDASGREWADAVIGTALALLLFALGWWCYDRLWSSRLGDSVLAAGGVSIALLLLLAWGLSQLLSGRLLFVHTGALLGSIMTLNVWLRVVPGLTSMSTARATGAQPDAALVRRAYLRTLHNSYLMFPTVVLMLSTHFPLLYGHRYAWVVMCLVIVAFALARHVVATGGAGKWALPPAIGLLAIGAVVVGTVAPGRSQSDAVPFASARRVVIERCLECHSSVPDDKRYAAAAGGIALDTPQEIARHAARIRDSAVRLRTMPPGDGGGMTDAERALLGHWIEQGAKLE